MNSIRINPQITVLPQEKIASLRKLMPLTKALILLAYSRPNLQPLMMSEDFFLCKLSTQEKNSYKKKFIEIAKGEKPLGTYLPYKGLEKYKAFEYLNALGYQHLIYQRDLKTGYDGIAFYGSQELLIGISGSDETRQDWLDNNMRLMLPKGPLMPSQFGIIKDKMDQMILAYKSKTGDFPKKILVIGHSLGSAVATMAYGELYFKAIDQGSSIQLITYNGAPLRKEYFEDCLKARALERNKKTTIDEVKKIDKQMFNIINAEDIVNNLAYTLVDHIHTLDHIGYRLIIKSNESERLKKNLRYYAKEHINLKALLVLEPAENQNMKDYSKVMIDNSKWSLQVELKESMAEKSKQMKEQLHKKNYIEVDSTNER